MPNDENTPQGYLVNDFELPRWLDVPVLYADTTTILLRGLDRSTRLPAEFPCDTQPRSCSTLDELSTNTCDETNPTHVE